MWKKCINPFFGGGGGGISLSRSLAAKYNQLILLIRCLKIDLHQIIIDTRFVKPKKVN